MYKKSIIVLITLFIHNALIGMKRAIPDQTQQLSTSLETPLLPEIFKEIASFITTKQWWYLDKVLKHDKCIKSVYYDSSGRLIEVGVGKRNIFIRDILSHQRIASIAHPKTVIAIYPDPFGKKIATGTEDSKARIFDIPTRKEIDFFATPDIYANVLCFHPCGTQIATGGTHLYKTIEEVLSTKIDHGKVSIFAMQSHKKTHFFSHDFSIDSICFNPAGTLLAIGTRDSKAHIFDIKLGQEIISFNNNDYNGCVDAICFSLDGNLLAAASNNQTNIFDMQLHKEVASFTCTDDVKSICFSPSRALLISTASYKNTYIFVQHENFTLEQLQLKNAFLTWLLIEKPNQKINNLKKLISDVALKCAILYNKLIAIWRTFPKNMQTALLQTMLYKIQTYGKTIS